MKTTPTTNYAGVDVSKSKLDAHHRRWRAAKSFPNTPAGIRLLFGALPPGTHVVCEASGGYERPLRDAAFAADVPVSVVNAARPRDFARSQGLLAKTDAIDAQLLTLYAEKSDLPADVAPSATVLALAAASRRRAVLVGQLAREKNALEKASERFVKADIRAGIKNLERRVAKFGAHISALIASDSGLQSKRERLEEVTGVGPVASATVLAECPELGTISDGQASSLAGLAPFNRDSGKWRGQRTVQGGRGQLRRALYMPALCAATHNPTLKAFYRGLIARGKPHKVALTAVMRKLVRLLNRLLADPDFALS